MSRMNMVEALNNGLHLGMRENENVVLLGEDVGLLGGVFRVSAGLQETFGSDRVLDTPLSETGIIASAIGMALYGLRPIAEIQFADFAFPAFDQIINELVRRGYTEQTETGREQQQPEEERFLKFDGWHHN